MDIISLNSTSRSSFCENPAENSVYKDWDDDPQRKLLNLARSLEVTPSVLKYLLIAGFDTIPGVASIEDTKILVDYYRKSFRLFNETLQMELYGFYVNEPQSFDFNPGTLERLMTLITTCQKVKTSNETYMTISNVETVSRDIEHDSSVRILETAYGSGDTPTLLDLNSLEQIDDVKVRLMIWCEKQEGPLKTLQYGTDFTVHWRNTDAACEMSLCCKRCGNDVKLFEKHGSVKISNGTRHIMECVAKMKRKRKVVSTLNGVLEVNDSKDEATVEKKIVILNSV